MRGVPGVAVALMVVMPGIALAQSPDPPRVELGAQSSKRIRDEGQSWSLRLTVPVKRRTAIEGTANIQKSYLNFGQNARVSAMEFSVHWRQTVFTSGSVQVFGVLGGGRNRVVHNVPERIAQGGIVEPPFTFVSSEFVAHFGPAVQVELAPWLALRGDVRGTLGERDSGVNVMVGAVIQIRRSRAGDPPAESTPPSTLPSTPPSTPPSTLPSTLPSTPPPAAWQRVKRGREVWVTTNTGSLVHGEIAAISDSSLSIREADREVTIRLDDVRLVEGRDSKKNGFLIGAVFGAVAGGLLGHSAGKDFFSSTGSGDTSPIFFLVGSATGVAVGGLLGAMVDGLIPGRQTLFPGNAIRVTPVITPSQKAVNVTVQLR